MFVRTLESFFLWCVVLSFFSLLALPPLSLLFFFVAALLSSLGARYPGYENKRRGVGRSREERYRFWISSSTIYTVPMKKN
jgi:hypothetical protein